MLTNRAHARNIIKSLYGDTFRFRITTQTTIGVRPVAHERLGLPTLVWRASASGVQIGKLLPGNDIDWQWNNA